MNFRPLHDRVVVRPIKGEEKSKGCVIMSERMKHGDAVIVDRSYIRAQATEALKTLVAPLSGVYAAALGPISTAAEPPTPQKSTNRD